MLNWVLPLASHTILKMLCFKENMQISFSNILRLKREQRSHLHYAMKKSLFFHKDLTGGCDNEAAETLYMFLWYLSTQELVLSLWVLGGTSPCQTALFMPPQVWLQVGWFILILRSTNSRFSHDVTTGMLVPLNKEKAAMLVSRPNPPGIYLYYYANASFCFRWKTWLLITWVKTSNNRLTAFDKRLTVEIYSTTHSYVHSSAFMLCQF